MLLNVATRPDPPPELSSSLSRYWNALTRGDHSTALEYVSPEFYERCLNPLRRTIRSWMLEAIRPTRPDEFEAFVRVLMSTPSGYRVHRLRESWCQSAGVWKVVAIDEAAGSDPYDHHTA